MAGEVSEAEWREFVRDERLSAGVDFPISLFWNDLVKMYPKAKVKQTQVEASHNECILLLFES